MKKVIVCGGRTYGEMRCELCRSDPCDLCRSANITNRTVFNIALNKIKDIDLIIEGGAKGADYLAHQYAQHNGIHSVTVEAKWYLHGKAAGPIRNAEMLDLNPTLVVAFPGGRGTANMVKQARDAGVEVIEVVGTSGNQIRVTE